MRCKTAWGGKIKRAEHQTNAKRAKKEHENTQTSTKYFVSKEVNTIEAIHSNEFASMRAMGTDALADVGDKAHIQLAAMSDLIVNSESKIYIDEHKINAGHPKILNHTRVTGSRECGKVLDRNK